MSGDKSQVSHEHVLDLNVEKGKYQNCGIKNDSGKRLSSSPSYQYVSISGKFYFVIWKYY